MLNLPPGHATTTLESKTNFFAAGRAGTARAEATRFTVAGARRYGKRG